MQRRWLSQEHADGKKTILKDRSIKRKLIKEEKYVLERYLLDIEMYVVTIFCSGRLNYPLITSAKRRRTIIGEKRIKRKIENKSV
jgi:hypothetical protein